MIRLLDWLIGALGAGAVLLICGALGLRNFAPSLTPDWSDEAAVMMLIWAMFLSGLRISWEKSHIAVDLLQAAAPPRLRRGMEIFALIAVIIFAVGMAASGGMVVYQAIALGERTESTASIPTWIYYASLPAGMAAIAAGLIARIFVRAPPEQSAP